MKRGKCIVIIAGKNLRKFAKYVEIKKKKRWNIV